MLLKIIFTTALVSCFSGNLRNYADSDNKRIVVIGIAENDKDAAVVLVENGPYYIIDGLDEWGDKYYKKKVRVSGKLVVEEHTKMSTDSVHVQERVGTWRILKRPKWELVK